MNYDILFRGPFSIMACTGLTRPFQSTSDTYRSSSTDRISPRFSQTRCRPDSRFFSFPLLTYTSTTAPPFISCFFRDVRRSAVSLRHLFNLFDRTRKLEQFVIQLWLERENSLSDTGILVFGSALSFFFFKLQRCTQRCNCTSFIEVN